MAFRLREAFLVSCLASLPLHAEERVVLSGSLRPGGPEFGWFGWSVDISGETAVAGAPKGHVDDQGRRSGRAYVFQFDGTGWEQRKELVPSEPALNDFFGDEVSISGDTVVVEGGAGSKIFIFERNQSGPDQWGEVRKIAFADRVNSFDVDGDTLLVDTSNLVLVFEKSSGGTGNWSPVAILRPPGTSNFAGSLSLSGDTAAILSSDGVGIFERDLGVAEGFRPVKMLPFFGFVRLDGDTLIVTSGGVNIFDRDRGGLDQWGRVAVLSDVDPVPPWGDDYGDASAISRNVIVVGAPMADTDDLRGYLPGAAFVYLRDEGGADQWGLSEKIFGFDFQGRFGSAVSAWNDTFVVGSFLADSPFEDIGAAFVYTVDTAPSATCTALPSYSAGTLTLDFELASPAPVTWELSISIPSTTTRVWSVSLPPIAPPLSFSLPISGVPQVGKIGFLSLLTSPTKGLLCTDWKVVDTGVP